MKLQNKVRWLPLLWIFLVLVQLCSAQSSKNLDENEKLAGKIKSVVFQRTYLIYKGQKINAEPLVLGADLFDAKERLIQTSVFSNGEERTVIKWAGDTYTASVNYFDSNGKPAPNLKSFFAPQTDQMPENDLCSAFTLKREKDIAANIEREYEVCSDNTIRRTTTSEYSIDNHILKEVVQDSKGRTWETTYNYGVNFVEIGYRYTVNNLKKPKYWHELTFGDKQLDEKNNWIRWVKSATNSLYPGQIRYQYIEERKITYYD